MPNNGIPLTDENGNDTTPTTQTELDSQFKEEKMSDRLTAKNETIGK